MSEIDLWFGDSWVIGAELQNITPKIETPHKIFPHRGVKDNPYYAFSTLTSLKRNNKFYNFGKEASSIGFSLYSLLSFCKNQYSENDNYTAFLCLTGETRNFSINNDNLQYHYNINYPDNSSQHGFINQYKFDPYLYEYENTLVLNQFYLVCEKFNIELVILPVWTEMDINNSVALIPPTRWLISGSTLVHASFGNNYQETVNTHTDIDYEYYSPLAYHPNLLGHKLLSEKLIELLNAS